MALCLSTGTDANPPEEKDISVYPNPSKSYLVVSFPDPIGKGSLNLFSMPGTTIFEKQLLNERDVEINLKNIDPGIYLLIVNDGEKKYCRKIVIPKN